MLVENSRKDAQRNSKSGAAANAENSRDLTEEELELMRRDDPVLSQKAESEHAGHSASTYYYLEPGGDDGRGVDGVMEHKEKRGLMESAAVFVVNKRTGGELPPDEEELVAEDVSD